MPRAVAALVAAGSSGDDASTRINFIATLIAVAQGGEEGARAVIEAGGEPNLVCMSHVSTSAVFVATLLFLCTGHCLQWFRVYVTLHLRCATIVNGTLVWGAGMLCLFAKMLN